MSQSTNHRHLKIRGHRYRFERIYDRMSHTHAVLVIHTAPSGVETGMLFFPEAIPAVRSYLDLELRAIREDEKRSSLS